MQWPQAVYELLNDGLQGMRIRIIAEILCRFYKEEIKFM